MFNKHRHLFFGYYCLIPSCFKSSLLIISQITGAFSLSSLTVDKLLDKLTLLFFNLFISKIRILYKTVIFMFCLKGSQIYAEITQRFHELMLECSRAEWTSLDCDHSHSLDNHSHGL